MGIFQFILFNMCNFCGTNKQFGQIKYFYIFKILNLDVRIFETELNLPFKLCFFILITDYQYRLNARFPAFWVSINDL